MRERDEFVRLPYLLLSVAVTAGLLSLPSLVVWAADSQTQAALTPLTRGIIGAVGAVLLSFLCARLWGLTQASVEIGFGEFMLWSWLRRFRAERHIARGGELLIHQLEADAGITPAEQEEILRSLNDALESKDPYTRGHSRRVQRHAQRIALALGFSDAKVAEIGKAASLHDVGKVGVPLAVLRKEGALSADERRGMEVHPVVGAKLISGLGSARLVAAVRHHHERWDGKGYPDGLRGHSIPTAARVIAVSDAYDAMTSIRPYRPRMSSKKARAILKKEAGRQFDPQVVAAFLAGVRAPAGFALIAGTLASARYLLGESAVYAKLGSVAPALGAAGTAAVVAASALAPTLPRTEPPRPAVKSASRSSDQKNALPATTNYALPDEESAAVEQGIEPLQNLGGEVTRDDGTHQGATGDLQSTPAATALPVVPEEGPTVPPQSQGQTNHAPDGSDSGASQSGKGQSGKDESGKDESGKGQPGDGQSGDEKPGKGQSGSDEPGNGQSGDGQAGDASGDDQSGGGSGGNSGGGGGGGSVIY